MLYNIHLFVKLRIIDLVATTAKNTIVRRLKHKNVSDLQKEDYWIITVDVGGLQEAEVLADKIATKSNLFVNPNKHTYKIKISEHNKQNVLKDLFSSANDGYKFLVVVSNFDDTSGELTKQTMINRLHYKNIVAIKKNILWILSISSKTKKDAYNIVKNITFCTSRTSGLLVNPHINSCKIISV